MAIISYIAQIFQTPAIFISLIACVGLILQKKSISEILRGTFKCMLGIFILNEGVALMQAAMGPLTTMFQALAPAGVQHGELADYGAFMGQWMSTIGMIMVVGFIFNLIIAKFTPLKTVYLTGHMMLFYAMLWTGFAVGAGFKGAGMFIFALIGYLLSITITPQILLPFVSDLTGSRQFTIGHSGTIWCIVASLIGKAVGKAEKKKGKEIDSMETINFPKGLSWLKDTSLASGIFMVIFYAVMCIIIPAETRMELTGGDAFTFCLTNGMKFAVGLVILLMGCRMMMAEIIPAFTGISNKLIPGAVPALDIPMLYPYGSNSLMIGYIISLVVSIIVLAVVNATGLSAYVLVPLTAAVYFDVSSGSVLANHFGGKKAVIIWSIVGGVGIMLITTIAMPLVASTVGTFVQTMGFSECSVWIIIVGYIQKFIHLFV